MKTAQSILSQFEKTSGIWLTSIIQYSEEQFAGKPDANSWSIGQGLQSFGVRYAPLSSAADRTMSRRQTGWAESKNEISG